MKTVSFALIVAWTACLKPSFAFLGSIARPALLKKNLPRCYSMPEVSPQNIVNGDTLNGDSIPVDPNGATTPLLLPESFLTLPRHPTEQKVNQVLAQMEGALRSLHSSAAASNRAQVTLNGQEPRRDAFRDRVFANSYVDLGSIDTVGFDYDYTLVTYTDSLLELIYDMALKRLVVDRDYPLEMLESGLRFDPCFSIRGLAVDKENGWICHLSSTHKVAVAWEGREKVDTPRIYEEYRGKRVLRPADRKKRLKPLNDLFSMAECCLIADTIQYFKERNIPYCPRNVVTDILSTIRETHISGDFHRIVANNPAKYFHPTPHLKQVLTSLQEAGKRLIFVSNSPFWYVDAGMKYVIGPNWRDSWGAIVTSAGKPAFYTENSRPFREICLETGRTMFHKVERFKPGAVYTEGCLRQLTRLIDWSRAGNGSNFPVLAEESSMLASSNVLYIGDSMFADLVDAKREYGWTTAAVTPEVGQEMNMHFKRESLMAQRSIGLLLNALRLVQYELGPKQYTVEDTKILDELERLVSVWRDRETQLYGNPFGSVFRARHQPSLFAHSLRRYCDLYMSSVSSLRLYSPEHRFYPEQNDRLLAHEISTSDMNNAGL